MNIVLIGMRGSGKTSVGKLLAERLLKSFYDLDTILAAKEKMPITEVIAKHGWEYFRDKESEIAEGISGPANAVISTGGGVILREKNILALQKNGKFVYLKTSIDTMLKRIGESSGRPPLTNQPTITDEIKQVLFEREPLYQKIANITVETDNKSIQDVVNEIMKQL
jgi:shikimate kinase